MFDIGDKVWVPRVGRTKSYITCPYCMGNKYLTVILGDGTQVKSDCSGCREGLFPEGKISVWDFGANVEEITITGVEINLKNGKREVEYHHGDSGCFTCYTNVFSTKEEAMGYARSMADEERKHEHEKLESKEHPSKTWAQNAISHLESIRRIEKDLEYHKKKLEIANGHIKK